MNRTVLVVGVMVTLIAGLVSADLIPTFGNVEGEADVLDPVFYLDGSKILHQDVEPTVYRNLSLGSVPMEENETFLFDGNRLVFLSHDFGIEESFYQAQFSLIFWGRTNDAGNLLQFEFVRISADLVEEIICVPEPVEIGATQQFQRYETSCFSDSEIPLDEGDTFGIEITGAGGTSEYWIKTGQGFADGFSRMEVIGPSAPAVEVGEPDVSSGGSSGFETPDTEDEPDDGGGLTPVIVNRGIQSQEGTHAL